MFQENVEKCQLKSTIKMSISWRRQCSSIYGSDVHFISKCHLLLWVLELHNFPIHFASEFLFHVVVHLWTSRSGAEKWLTYVFQIRQKSQTWLTWKEKIEKKSFNWIILLRLIPISSMIIPISLSRRAAFIILSKAFLSIEKILGNESNAFDYLEYAHQVSRGSIKRRRL